MNSDTELVAIFMIISWATPPKACLTALHVICLHIFRHITQIFLAIRQYCCVEFMQSDEKSDCASATQSLCDVALAILSKMRYNRIMDF